MFSVERLPSWCPRLLDAALFALAVTGALTDPLAFSHGIAIVLVLQAFLLERRAAAVRVGLTALLTTAASVAHGAAVPDVAIQVPFVYGLATLVVLLAHSLRRSRSTTEAALRDAERLALYDTLTGLPNRVLFHDRVEHALDLARRDRTSVALLLMDLDRFKEVNDTFGHHVGDLLLREMGPHLGEELRDGDTLARLGGDEFAVLLPGAGAAVAVSVAERLVRAVERPFVIDGQALSVGASVGIACSPEHASDAGTLLRRADVAMYVAKRAPGSYAMYSPGIQMEDGMTRRGNEGQRAGRQSMHRRSKSGIKTVTTTNSRAHALPLARPAELFVFCWIQSSSARRGIRTERPSRTCEVATPHQLIRER